MSDPWKDLEMNMFGGDGFEQPAKRNAGCPHGVARAQLCDKCNPRGERKGSLAVTGHASTHRPDEDEEEMRPASQPVSKGRVKAPRERTLEALEQQKRRRAAREAAEREAPAEAPEPKKPRIEEEVPKRGKMKAPGCLPRGWCPTSRMGPCPPVEETL